RAGFCRIRHRIACPASAKIDVNIRKPCRRIENRKQPATQILSQAQKTLIAGQLIAGEKATEQAYRHLEIFDVDVAIEREITSDKRMRSFRLGIEMHQDERVECIDWRHQERLS